jgi:hypothetical protein
MMLALAATMLMGSSVALAASAAEIDPDVDVALKKLYDTVPGGKVLAARARGTPCATGIHRMLSPAPPLCLRASLGVQRHQGGACPPVSCRR